MKDFHLFSFVYHKLQVVEKVKNTVICRSLKENCIYLKAFVTLKNQFSDKSLSLKLISRKVFLQDFKFSSLI